MYKEVCTQLSLVATQLSLVASKSADLYLLSLATNSCVPLNRDQSYKVVCTVTRQYKVVLYYSIVCTNNAHIKNTAIIEFLMLHFLIKISTSEFYQLMPISLVNKKQLSKSFGTLYMIRWETTMLLHESKGIYAT